MARMDSVRTKPLDRCLQVATILWSGSLIFAVVLLSRRLAGEFVPVSAWPSVVVSLISAILSLTAWSLFLRFRPQAINARSELVVAVVAWLPPWLAGIAVCPEKSVLAQGWLLGIAILTAVIFSLTSRWNWSALRSSNWLEFVGKNSLSKGRLIEEQPSPEVAATPNPSPQTSLPEIVESALPRVSLVSEELARQTPDEQPLGVFQPTVPTDSDGTVTHWMTRQTLPDGVEQLEGAVRIHFVSQQRAASVHIPFTPPFRTTPQVECEAANDDTVRWKVSVVYPYGMRIDLKRGANSEPAEIELAYSAMCEVSQTDAA